MGRYVSIRRKGSLTVLPTPWLILGIVVPVGGLMSGLWLHSSTPRVEAVLRAIIDTVETLFWIGTASICAFTAAMLFAGRGERARTLFLTAAGLASLWLCLDEAFRLSGEVLPSAGVPSSLAFAFRASVAALYVAASWRFVLTGRTSLFALAVLLFCAGLNADVLASGDDQLRFFLEEALKLLALAFWAGFHIVAAATAVEELAAGRITTVHVSQDHLIRRPA